MKVFQDFLSKLDSTEKHESNFGNLCMKKGGSFPPSRAYATAYNYQVSDMQSTCFAQHRHTVILAFFAA